MYTCIHNVYVLMRDEKEGIKKQARSIKQTTRQSNTAHVHVVYTCTCKEERLTGQRSCSGHDSPGTPDAAALEGRRGGGEMEEMGEKKYQDTCTPHTVI